MTSDHRTPVIDKIGMTLAWVVTFGVNVKAPFEAPKTTQGHHVPRPDKPLCMLHGRMH